MEPHKTWIEQYEPASGNRDDLLVVAKLSGQSYSWVREQKQADRQQAAA